MNNTKRQQTNIAISKNLLKVNQVMIHLKRERFPKRAYHKLASRKIGPCKILKKISSNASVVELPDDLQISPIFNIANLFEFHGFDNDRGCPVMEKTNSKEA
ncbi:hypothetical protein CDL12_25438 [Handroanthus impetiginosus]|uniref:Tf2-1-like SH3-like domain-containing protein n=1 Tax=Handroanthus impetiginosus TaxID=429701 RepID=A0A2G9G9T4_9LAMI|nr:hypothetical protein CDL12_25438 [Handroanthus impetiginosus]